MSFFLLKYFEKQSTLKKMKKNDVILFLATTVFVVLFYKQQLGINLLLLNVILIVLSLVNKPNSIKSTAWCVLAAGCLLTATAVFYNGLQAAVLFNVLSLLLLSALSIAPNTSLIFAAIHGLYTYVTSFLYMCIDFRQRQLNRKSTKPLSTKIILLVLPVAVTTLFFFMYQSSNPIFNFYTQKINLDFISLPWLRFVIIGFVLMYGFFYSRQIEPLALVDSVSQSVLQPNQNYKSYWGKDFTLQHEFILARTVFSLLNILLLLVNVLDVVYLWGGAGLPLGLNYTDFVHQGTGTLIASIIFAVLLILYFYRGPLHFYNNKLIVVLCCLWIGQNVFMILSTAYRNHIYIEDYFLTYKRLGVYLYLVLCCIGLITTSIKILQHKSNWYLFRTNAWLFYGIMLLLSLFDWDSYITQYNITSAQIKNRPIDKNYLADLSFNNLTDLILMNDSIQQIKVDDENKFSSSINFKRKFYDSYHYEPDFKTKLHYKLYKFMEQQSVQQWPSFVINNNCIANTINEIAPQKITALHLSNNGIETLKPIASLKHIRGLDVSHNPWKNVIELSVFEQLQNLNISYTQLDTLDALPKLSKLKSLNISGNENLQFHKLKIWDALIDIDLSKTNLHSLNQLPHWPQLRAINLAENEINDLSGLNKYKNLGSLNLSKALQPTKPNLPQLDNLDTLVLSYNPEALNQKYLLDFLPFKNLKHCDLSFNNLKTFPLASADDSTTTGIFNCLNNLNLSNNTIDSIKVITPFYNLKSLNVAHNTLTDISDINKFGKLETLSLNNNRFLKTMQPIPQMQSIIALDISGNKMMTDYQDVSTMLQLQTLDMSDMSIDSIEFIRPLTKLSYLDLSYNRITSIEALTDKLNLTELILSGNKIADLTPLYKLNKLNRLVLIDVASIEQLRLLKQALPNTQLITSMDDSVLKSTTNDVQTLN